MGFSFPLLYFKKLLIVMSFPLILFFNSSNTHWTLLEVAHSMSVIQPSKENRFFFFFFFVWEWRNPSNESGICIKQSSVEQSIFPGP